MALPAGTRLVALDTADRLEEVLRFDAWTFPTGTPLADRVATESGIPWGRAWAVETLDGDLRAMYGCHGLRRFPVPGAVVPVGWLTWVGVHPVARRQGILRELISHHFADCLARGEAVSGLNAAEAAIYGRFGYGQASTQVSLTVPRGAALRDVAGSSELSLEMREWDPERDGPVVEALHAAYAQLPAGLGRPGWATWETPTLRKYVDQDPPALRGGQEPQRLVLVRDGAGELRGYARFRRKPEWQLNVPRSSVQLRDIVALDPAAAHRLWSVLLDLDLMATVAAGPLASDDPILSLLVDARAALPTTNDMQWIRILDLPRALAERRYAAPVDVVLEVTDALIPANAGRWRVVADAFGHAAVTRVDTEQDLRLDIRELGSAHLGSTSLAALAQAGLVRGTAEPLARAAVAWSWPVAAGVDWVF
ncbi:GNAT family N-acetyltransferase [Leucobacter luti]|uniref:Putative acetyltransferase n=1 Tax=Leucobacter luti TaxID=340320 RepID=A0A4Q7TST4_9MICO|nr:GNAT family N-acetyltransferase [Leucobacter luti]MBL3699904.1 GNAT family N-acetyltransferase [Leucobacter luti]RZT62778.1 putative acetyltransferase [Leucobacter luti]